MYKKILLSVGLAALLCSTTGKAQCDNLNGDFETYTGPIVTDNDWINNNLNNWNASHGSPTIFSTPTNNMWMWSYNSRGEGVYTSHPFFAGDTYTISYSLWRDDLSNPASEFRVAMTNSLLPEGNTGGIGTTLPTTTGDQNLTTQPWVNTGSWVKITETVVATSNYSQLWFYPFLSAAPTDSSKQAAVRIDSVCITRSMCGNINGDFETYLSPITPGNPWIDSDMVNWTVSHGDPTVLTSPTTNMQLTSVTNTGDGVYTDYNFVLGQSYTLCYSLWRDAGSDPASEFKAELSHSLAPGGGPTIPIVPSNQPLNTQPWTGTGSWVTITETFTATDNFTQIWFYPYLAGGIDETQAICQIDSVCIKTEREPVDPCSFKPQLVASYDNECAVTLRNVTVLPPGLKIIGAFWTFGDGSSAVASTTLGASVDHFYANSGAYNACLTIWMENEAGEQCCATACIRVNTRKCDPCNLLARIKIDRTGSNPYTFSAPGMPLILTSAVGYYWDFGDGTTGIGQSLNHTFATAGTYTVCVTVFYYDANTQQCCNIKLCETITCGDPDPDVGGGRAPQGSQGIEEEVNESPALHIYPNPSSGIFNLELNGENSMNTITIYDQAGKLVHRVENINSTSRYELDLRDLEKGLYIIIVNESDPLQRSFDKIIVQ
jgi:hypothetical protein